MAIIQEWGLLMFVHLSHYQKNSMDHCINSAKELSRMIGDLVPHFYGHAASSDSRKSLSNLRKLEYEGLESRFFNGDWIDEDTRMPDVWSGEWGENERRFGAVAIGAREYISCVQC